MINLNNLIELISSQIEALQKDNLDEEIIDKKSLGFLISYINYLFDKYFLDLNYQQKKSLKKILILESFSKANNKYPVLTIFKLCSKFHKEKEELFFKGINKMDSLSLFYLHLESKEEPHLFYFFVKNEYKKIAC